MKNYILASNKKWHIDFFIANRNLLPGKWSIVTCTSDLEEQVFQIKPRYVFFPHWSEIVSTEILCYTECVCFHMTDLPYGRGGSPLQNLIAEGHSKTVITALKMTEEIDAGPVYFKRNFELSGSALEIYQRTAPICFDIMKEIVSSEIVPAAQVGRPKVFKRRTPRESELNQVHSLEKFYDYIRMLDAPGYPAAFLKHNGMKIEFLNASWSSSNEIKAIVKVSKDEE